LHVCRRFGNVYVAYRIFVRTCTSHTTKSEYHHITLESPEIFVSSLNPLFSRNFRAFFTLTVTSSLTNPWPTQIPGPLTSKIRIGIQIPSLSIAPVPSHCDPKETEFFRPPASPPIEFVPCIQLPPLVRNCHKFLLVLSVRIYSFKCVAYKYITHTPNQQ